MQILWRSDVCINKLLGRILSQIFSTALPEIVRISCADLANKNSYRKDEVDQNVEHHVRDKDPVDPFRKFGLVQSHREENRDHWREFPKNLFTSRTLIFISYAI